MKLVSKVKSHFRKQLPGAYKYFEGSREEYLLLITSKHAYRRVAWDGSVRIKSIDDIQLILKQQGLEISIQEMSSTYRKYSLNDWDDVLKWVKAHNAISPVKKQVQRFAKLFPNVSLVEFEPAQLFHGTNSGSLLMFTQYGKSLGGLASQGRFNKIGRVPFSGENGIGATPAGINHNSVSTVSINNIDEAVGYSLAFKSKASSSEATDVIRSRMLSDLSPVTRNTVEQSLDTLSQKRSQAWLQLTPTEKQLVEEGFPVLYGIRPAHSTRARKLVHVEHPEINLMNFVPFNEISFIFVPSGKVRLVKDLISASSLDASIEVRSYDIILSDFELNRRDRVEGIITGKDLLHQKVYETDPPRWEKIKKMNQLTSAEGAAPVEFVEFIYSELGLNPEPDQIENAVAAIQKWLRSQLRARAPFEQHRWPSFFVALALRSVFSSRTDRLNSATMIPFAEKLSYLGLNSSEIKLIELLVSNFLVRDILNGEIGKRKAKSMVFDLSFDFGIDEVQLFNFLIDFAKSDVQFFGTELKSHLRGVRSGDMFFGHPIIDKLLEEYFDRP